MAVRRISQLPTLKLWVLVLLVFFLALCGIHLMGAHHDTHGDELGLATAALALLAALGFAEGRRHQPERGDVRIGAWPPLRPHCLPSIRAPIRT